MSPRTPNAATGAKMAARPVTVWWVTQPISRMYPDAIKPISGPASSAQTSSGTVNWKDGTPG
jgi:hypothetical protein